MKMCIIQKASTLFSFPMGEICGISCVVAVIVPILIIFSSKVIEKRKAMPFFVTRWLRKEKN